jgi:Flp pilus assembly protein TadD
MPERRTVETLFDDARWALDRDLPAREVTAMLQKLLRRAPEQSEPAHFARRHLGRLLLPAEPFRAARLLKEALTHFPNDDELWGLLGIAFSLLGEFRAAHRAYRKALALKPSSGFHLHNLGHLLDVALGRPEQAIPYLEAARRALPDEGEVKSSLAHALFRAGHVVKARGLLLQAFHGCETRTDQTLESWSRSR